MGTVELVIGGQARSHTCLRFNADILTQPPTVTGKQATAPEGTLDAVILHLRIHVEGEGDIPHIKMRIDGVSPDKKAVVHLVEVIPNLRHNGIVAPVTGVLDVVIVPEQPAGPGFDAGVETQGNVFTHREFKADIGFCHGIPQQIGTQTHPLPPFHRIARF